MSESNVQEKPADIRTTVRQHYGEAAASFKPKGHFQLLRLKRPRGSDRKQAVPQLRVGCVARGSHWAIDGLW